MLKRAIVLLLCAGFLFCVLPADCAARAATTALSQASPAQARQYGEEQELVVDQSGLSGQILYPAGDVENLDTILLTWASLTLSECEKRVQDAGAQATLQVDYEAYESAGRFVGIEEYGVFKPADGGEAEYLLYTCNYDLAAGKPLALSETIGDNHMDAVIALIQKNLAQAGIFGVGNAGVVTKDDLRQFVLRADGIEWLFVTDAGVVGVVVTYDKLLPYLALSQSAPAPTSAPVPAAAPAPAQKPQIEQIAVCIHDGAHIRSGPGTTYELVDTIRANTQLEVVKSDVTEGWHEIWYQNRICYIATSLVRLSSQPEALTAGWIVGNGIHIRAGAGTNYAIIGALNNGAQVEIIQRQAIGQWDKIWFENQVAYVHDRYVRVGSRPESEPVPAATAAPSEISPQIISKSSVSVSEVGTCTTGGVVVRAARSGRADYYGKLHAGEQVYILQYGDTWCEVFVPVSGNNGYVGYAHTKYLEIYRPEVPEPQQENPKLVIGITGMGW